MEEKLALEGEEMRGGRRETGIHGRRKWRINYMKEKEGRRERNG